MPKKIIRVVANVPYLAHTENLFEKYNITKVHNIYKTRLLREYYFSAKRNNTLLQVLANLSGNLYRYSSRTPEVWKVPHFRTNYAYQMLCNNLPRLLNSYNRAGYHLQHFMLREFKMLMRSPLQSVFWKLLYCDMFFLSFLACVMKYISILFPLYLSSVIHCANVYFVVFFPIHCITAILYSDYISVIYKVYYVLYQYVAILYQGGEVSLKPRLCGFFPSSTSIYHHVVHVCKWKSINQIKSNQIVYLNRYISKLV